MAEIKRFNPYHRILHIVMALSFLGLVASGMPLKYSHAPWASWLMKLLGGYQAAGTIHRVCGAITFGYFAAHILFVLYDIAVIRKFRFNPLGPESMVPWIKDLEDIIANFKWFLGLGPKPLFDRFIPGWGFNIATIIHSDEALLAAGFIFTIHFFNTHLRPEKFPMDYVIFSGTLSVDELKHERPLEYQRLTREKRLAGLTVPGQKPWLTDLGILFGFGLVVVGLVLLVLIILGQFYY